MRLSSLRGAPHMRHSVFAGDEQLTTAPLDCLAHHATVLSTKGKSYRMRKRRTREEPSRSRRDDGGHGAALSDRARAIWRR